MTLPTPQVRVLAICESGPTREQVINALTAPSEFQLANVLGSLEKLSREVHVAEPDLLLIDHLVGGQATLDLIDELALQFPNVPIVAIVPDGQPVLAQQVTLAGARAFITTPFTQVTLLSTLRRVRDLEARRARTQEKTTPQPQAVQPMRAFAVYSPRGGVGCSTVAANLAIALQEATDARVLLIDGKLQFGHLDLLLNMRSRNTIADLIPHASALEAALLDDVAVEHISGVHVLLSPSDIQVAQGVRPEDLYNILLGVKRYYEYIVIDAGSALTENTVTILDTADRILLVAIPDLATLHDASRLIQIGRSLGYPPTKLAVILNRAGMPSGLRTNDIKTALHQEPFAVIAEDGPNTLRSINRGIPLLVKYPRSPASQGIRRLAQKLIEASAREALGAPAPAAAAQARKAGSRSRAAPARSTQRAKT